LTLCLVSVVLVTTLPKRLKSYILDKEPKIDTRLNVDRRKIELLGYRSKETPKPDKKVKLVLYWKPKQKLEGPRSSSRRCSTAPVNASDARRQGAAPRRTARLLSALAVGTESLVDSVVQDVVEDQDRSLSSQASTRAASGSRSNPARDSQNRALVLNMAFHRGESKSNAQSASTR
jgi:hypothetical protein